MVLCPTCRTENRDDAVVCVMCASTIGRVDGSRAAEEPIGELHTVDLPAALPSSRPLQFEERAIRRSSRPPPAMEERPVLRVSSRPPPRSPSHAPSPRPSALASSEPSGVERAFELLARPFDFLLRLAVRGPGASMTIADDSRQLRSSAPARMAFLLEAWGAVVCVLPAMLPTDGPMYVPFVVMAVLVLLAMGGRMWVARSWDHGDDPNPIAMVLASFLSFVGIASIVSVGAAALVGGLEAPVGEPLRLNATGRLFVSIPLVLYGLTGLAAFVRDRVRTARQRGG